MTELFIHKISQYEWPEESSPETDAAFRAGLPRNAARRMTRLGLLCARVLRMMPADPETAVVYATSMSETRTLEGYLDSFPEASPTRFQGSIHPAGAQQALIALERPTREFYPLTGAKNLLDQALQTSLLAESSDVVLVAGEEKGTWLHELGLTGDRSFAFALHLSANPTGAQAVVRHLTQESDASAPDLAAIFDWLNARKDWTAPSCPSGSWQWQWL